MGLDVYVGSLTRYYLGEWETIVQRIAREQGLQVRIVRRNQRKPSLITRLVDRLTGRTSPAAAAKAIDRWRHALGVASGLGENFTWNESLEYEYFTDKPAWDCYGGLLLWACYEHLPKATRAKVAGEWGNEPAYQTMRSLAAHPYPHLLGDTEFWFPIDFQYPFSATTILGETVAIGSSTRLLEELGELNRKTWGASPDELGEWRTEGAEYGEPLEKSAQLAFAILHELAKLS
ncbi:MAG: hypothetical protein ACTHQM_01350, partial [Thermoanaerobaculia bacterium]